MAIFDFKMGRSHMTDFDYGMIRGLYEKRANIAAIARRMKRSRATIAAQLANPMRPSLRVRSKSQTVEKRMKARRDKVVKLIQKVSLQDRQRISPKGRRVTDVKVEVRDFPSARSVARHLGNVSARTVCRDLHARGLRQWCSGFGPKLSQTDKEVRVKRARAMLQMSKARTSRIMFSDEKYFDLQTKRFVKLWGKTPPPHSGSDVQGGEQVLVLGFISRTNRRLDIIEEGTINADVYRRHLMAYKRIIKAHTFQQDNASPHSKLVRDGFFKKQKLKVVNWPPYSPDLNVIETLWAILADKVKQRGPQGRGELIEFIKKAWAEVKMPTIRALVDEFRDRLKVCVEGGGNLVTRTMLKAYQSRMKRAQAR